jgi:hypothetical protein
MQKSSTVFAGYFAHSATLKSIRKNFEHFFFSNPKKRNSMALTAWKMQDKSAKKRHKVTCAIELSLIYGGS